MLQRLLITLVQAKVGNAFQNLLNENHQTVCAFYRAKEITEKVYYNIVNSVDIYYKMDTMFMNSKNSKTYDPYRRILNLSNKINLRRSNVYVTKNTKKLG